MLFEKSIWSHLTMFDDFNDVLKSEEINNKDMTLEFN